MNSIIKRLGALCLGLGVLLVPALVMGSKENKVGSARQVTMNKERPVISEKFGEKGKAKNSQYWYGRKARKVKQEEDPMSQMDGISDGRTTDEKKKMLKPDSGGKIIPAKKIVDPIDRVEQQPLGRKGGIIPVEESEAKERGEQQAVVPIGN